ncbi:hypothetical protein Csa_014433 [Cucumis sativus]|uniref:Uncharacterized protein n=1 Tax=Cucumis sativus TaxID=3659 RepID=A0A0A0KVS7_CUCSA|nr:hypothetical protein Csa_014433 [Cucumis sativus]
MTSSSSSSSRNSSYRDTSVFFSVHSCQPYPSISRLSSISVYSSVSVLSIVRPAHDPRSRSLLEPLSSYTRAIPFLAT